MLTDNLLEMGFLGSQTSFRQRAALAEYLDSYLERKENERKENEMRTEMFRRNP